MTSKLDLVTQTLVDKLGAVQVDIYSLAKSINKICRLLECVDQNKISIRTKHRLCRSLAISYFTLLEEETNFPQILSYLRTCLTCMSLLKQSSIASQILCQALLERTLTYGQLFNEDFTNQKAGLELESLNDDCIRLSEENQKATLGHRFRRLPNHGRVPKLKSIASKQQSLTDQNLVKQPENISSSSSSSSSDIPDRKSINCYLLNEAFKSSINNIEAFAILFVEFHCPVTFDKITWPSDESLRVTNEKNLNILRRFEQIPPFWDLYELIGQAGCLGSCLTLIKALFTANLALWSSATTNSQPHKMSSTVRLIPPLAHSGLIPNAFGEAVQVFFKFAPAEVFAVLTDIWLYLKDTNTSLTGNQISNEKIAKAKAKIYLNRLRLFMCLHAPGKEYVRLFKEFHEESPADSSNP